MEMVLDWIVAYGYAALFCVLMLGIIGAPFPDDLILGFAGYLVFAGYFKPIPTVVFAFMGSLCGITVSYGLGRFLGWSIIVKHGYRFHITPQRLNKVTAWYNRFGKWSLVIGYFISGVRHWTAFVAGVSKLRMPVFALFAYTGGLIWSVTLISAGYILGEEWHCISTHGGCYTYLFVGTCLVLTLIGWLMHRRFGVLSFIPMKIFDKERNTVP